jgi:hypothetical protein
MEASLAGRARPRSDDPVRAWDGFPWLTLVLGSGCLELPDEPNFSAGGLAAGVADALETLEWVEGTDSPATIAQDYVETLARDRIRSEPAAGSANSTVKVDELAARLSLVAALLTRFFHLAQAAQPTAMSRWDDDVAMLDPALAAMSDLTRSLDAQVVTPVIEQILDIQRMLTTRTNHDIRESAVDALLTDIHDGLAPRDPRSPRVLHVEHLRLVTETAWHYLITDMAIYPGWTDLLLDLMLKDGGEAIEGTRRTRPSYANLQMLPDIVQRLLRKPTESSWEWADPERERVTVRDRMYAGAAEVLIAQAEALHESEFKLSLPPAAAFVTSFDLELEMALWIRLRERTEAMYSVAIPVHVLKSPASEEAELCWLLGDVYVASGGSWAGQLDRIQRPENWRLLTPEFDKPELLSRPIVVHLSGCPLFELPTLRQGSAEAKQLISDLDQVGISVELGTTTIAHAITVDEYLALRQSEAELFWLSNDRLDPDARTSRALPPDLLSDRDTNPRFWMALGLPIGDPAIRHRVVSQITVRRLRETADRPADTPARAASALGARPAAMQSAEETGLDKTNRRFDVDGVAINRRVDDDEANLLYWLGLDVVEADCRDFVDDLFHYAAHVRHDGPNKRPSTTASCTVVTKRGIK